MTDPAPSRSLRVLAVCNRYPPHGFGGYEVLNQATNAMLRAAGHDVRVLTTESANWLWPARTRTSRCTAGCGGTAVDLDRCAHWQFISTFGRQEALEQGHVLPRTSVNQPGVSLERFAPAPPQGWRWQLLYVGRIEPPKA